MKPNYWMFDHVYSCVAQYAREGCVLVMCVIHSPRGLLAACIWSSRPVVLCAVVVTLCRGVACLYLGSMTRELGSVSDNKADKWDRARRRLAMHLQLWPMLCGRITLSGRHQTTWDPVCEEDIPCFLAHWITSCRQCTSVCLGERCSVI